MGIASIIGALRVTLGIDAADFERGVDRARRGMGGLQKAATSLVGALAFTELAQAGMRALDYAGSLGEAAQKLGVTTKFMQEFRYAVEQSGGSTEAADTAIAKLAKTIGSALTGNKQAAAGFDQLGISMEFLNSHSIEESYLRVAEAIAKIPDPARQAAAAQRLFGKGATEILPLLKSGAVGFNEYQQAAQKLGIVLDDHLINQADLAADKLGEMKKVLEAQFATVVAQNVEPILSLANAIGGLATNVGWFFQTIEGNKRIMRDEGWAAGFFSNDTGKMETASSPDRYLKLRQAEYRNAVRKRQQLERTAESRYRGRAGDHELNKARAAEAEALRRVEAARGDVLGKYAGYERRPTGGSDIVDTESDRGKSGGGGKKEDPFDADWSKLKAQLFPYATALEEEAKKVAVLEQALARGKIELDQFNAALSEIRGSETGKLVEGARSISDIIDGWDEPLPEFQQMLEQARVGMEGLQIEAEATFDAMNAGAREVALAYEDFNRDVARGLSDAIVQGESLGDVLSNAFKRAGASLLESGILNFLTGGQQGTSFTDIFSAIGLSMGGVPAFANGGSFTVGGVGGVDRNLVAFKATRGEQVDIRTPGQLRESGRPVVIHADFRGADPAAVSAINGRIDRFESELSGRILNTVIDGRTRRIIR